MNEKEVVQSISLEEVCNDDNDGGFMRVLQEIPYCGIRPLNSNVECFYRDDEPDHNEMYRCKNPKHLDLDDVMNDASMVYDGIGHA